VATAPLLTAMMMAKMSATVPPEVSSQVLRDRCPTGSFARRAAEHRQVAGVPEGGQHARDRDDDGDEVNHVSILPCFRGEGIGDVPDVRRALTGRACPGRG
jgi:hypothetical protein